MEGKKSYERDEMNCVRAFCASFMGAKDVEEKWLAMGKTRGFRWNK